MGRVFTLASLCALLAGCAGAVPWNPQGYAGINQAEITSTCEGSESWCPESVTLTGGKEQGEVSVSFTTPNGTSVKYTASEVQAFDGQTVRAQVEQQISEDVREASPEIVNRITNAILQLRAP